MSSWLAIISRAAKKLPVFPQLSSFKTSLSPRRAMHCQPQKRMASETHLTMCLFLIIFFRFSSSVRLFTFCPGFSTELRKDSVSEDESLFPSLNFSAGLKKSTPGKSAYTCHFQQIGINATNIEKTGIHFKTDVFAAVAAVDAKAPY